MTEKPDNSSISRRRLLGGAATIGGAAALGGTGTMAFFSDEETFANNQLVAGELDMKVDWEEHYSDWSADEDDPGDSADPELDIQMDVTDASGYTAFPPGVEAYSGMNSDPLLYVHDDDVGQFMDNTSIDAFPDENDDGVQDDFDEENACEVLADVGADDDGLDPDGARTDNEDTRLEDGSAAPLINLQDVKPGDFGEVTLSFHLCDNPGYVWLNAANVDASENGLTEPERKDEDEDGPGGDTVELLDEIQTAWWYDENCDNLTDGGTGGGGQMADVVIVMDRSGSMAGELGQAQSGAEALVDALGANDQVSLVSFDGGDGPTGASLDQGLTTDKSAAKTAINGLSAGGGTNMESGVELGHEEVLSAVTFADYPESGNARPGARKIMVVLGDGSPNDSTGVTDSLSNNDPSEEATNAKNDGVEIFTIAYGTGGPVTLLNDMASDPNSNPEDQYAFVADTSDVVDAFEEIGGSVGGGEEIFFQGSLRAALGALTAGNGIPLDGDGGDDFDEFNDDPSADSRGCFDPTPATNCIGFSWWLPLDHGNEVQSDSAQFDLGFYTEQCRHNDGSGMAMGNSN
ncbi:MAG: vWA domain-containing protein [Halolamina sp.]